MSGGRDGCFKCGLDGHWARECPEDGDRRDGPRGGRGGFGRDRGGPGSRMDFRSGGGDKCYKCNRPGHFARECRLDQERCYKCNSLGHLARECSKEIDPGACYNCKSPGHVQRDCPEQSQRACFRCGENGHLARDCPEDPPSPIEKRKCYQCGENGHFVRECPDIPDGPKGGDRKCYGCGGVGHISRECPTAQRQAARDCFKRGGGPLRPLRERNYARRDGPYRRGDGPYRRSDDGPFRRSGGPYRWFASDRNRDSSRSPIRARARSVDWN